MVLNKNTEQYQKEEKLKSSISTEEAVNKVQDIIGGKLELSNVSDDMMELRELLPVIYACNKIVIGPVLSQKVGMNIVDSGKDYGDIQTVQDLQLSELLLKSVSEKYPGSFSEEQDSLLRTKENTVYQIDPLDGTGDLKYTLGLNNGNLDKVTPSTILISKLHRDDIEENFIPKASIIFDMINHFAFISDGTNVELYTFNENGEPKEVDFEIKDYIWTPESGLNINKRPAYSQDNYDNKFVPGLTSNLGIDVNVVPVGGAGTFPLHLLRNYIEPSQFVKGFSNLEPLSIGFNAQPDWKTWDTDPSLVLLKPFGLSPIVDVYGEPIMQNASMPELKKDLVHTSGIVLSTNEELSERIVESAKNFRDTYGDILKVNY